MKKQNSIFKKLVLIPLTSVAVMSSLAIGANSIVANAQTNEVGVYAANATMIDAAGGFTVDRVDLKLKVKNMAYEKKITVHYRDSASDEWKDYSASYSNPMDGGYEIWTAEPVFWGDYIEYAIKYEVNGQTYWDNNNGQNYKTYKSGVTEGL